ncbi:MAG: HPr family phosphocarrier protein, partial [Verrucomicrobiota bacterium]|nr:HPr family phosphocarrier protein [Verrucomicrobiota bacterium]
VKEGTAYPGKIFVQAKSGSCDLTSALECIMLGLEKGAEVSIQVTGPDEGTFGPKLVELLETHFDFPPQ